MQFGRFTITKKSLVNVFAKYFYGINSRRYWDNRFKRNWVSSEGRLQTGIFAASFCFQDFAIFPHSIIDYGCGGGDSIPYLKMRFPSAKLFLYDFSEHARKLCHSYQKYATICDDPNAMGEFDLVYCSNVVEHIDDIRSFIEELSKITGRYIVIQAPYAELHNDGKRISVVSPKGEHLRTVDDEFLKLLPSSFKWESRIFQAPYAWDSGSQVIFFGRKNDSAD